MCGCCEPAAADPYQARTGASLSASTGPVNSSIARLGSSTRGASGSLAELTQPSHIAAYPWEGVVVYPARAASAARTASTGGSPGGWPASGPEHWGSTIHTYTSTPGGPYRPGSHQ